MNKFYLVLFTCLLAAKITYGQGVISWGTPASIAGPGSGNDHPRVVVSRTGNPLVVWHSQGRCMFSRWNGAAFTTPANIAGTQVAGAFWMGPDIAAHGDTVYVVYKEIPETSASSHIYCLRSTNGGMSFSAPVQVDNIADSLARFPTVTTDGFGNPVVGFMKFDPFFQDARWVVARSTDLGATFQADVKASGWSSPAATVCDCCPSSIASSGSTLAML